jgi:hypothetical protein
MAARHAKRFCDGLARRDFLRLGTAGVFGLTLPDILAGRAGAAGGGRAGGKVSVPVTVRRARGLSGPVKVELVAEEGTPVNYLTTSPPARMAATRTASTRLAGSARPRPAMS